MLTCCVIITLMSEKQIQPITLSFLPRNISYWMKWNRLHFMNTNSNTRKELHVFIATYTTIHLTILVFTLRSETSLLLTCVTCPGYWNFSHHLLLNQLWLVFYYIFVIKVCSHYDRRFDYLLFLQRCTLRRQKMFSITPFNGEIVVLLENSLLIKPNTLKYNI